MHVEAPELIRGPVPFFALKTELAAPWRVAGVTPAAL